MKVVFKFSQKEIMAILEKHVRSQVAVTFAGPTRFVVDQGDPGNPLDAGTGVSAEIDATMDSVPEDDHR